MGRLETVFGILDESNAKLSASKSFVGYPSVHLLAQQVDAFGLATIEEKLAAISKLEFPKTLKGLEVYLNMTGYLCKYTSYYTQIAKPLQQWKTLLIRPNSPRSNSSYL